MHRFVSTKFLTKIINWSVFRPVALVKAAAWKAPVSDKGNATNRGVHRQVQLFGTSSSFYRFKSFDTLRPILCHAIVSSSLTRERLVIRQTC